MNDNSNKSIQNVAMNPQKKQNSGDILFTFITYYHSCLIKYHLFNIRKRQEFQPQSLVAGYMIMASKHEACSEFFNLC